MAGQAEPLPARGGVPEADRVVIAARRYRPTIWSKDHAHDRRVMCFRFGKALAAAGHVPEMDRATVADRGQLLAVGREGQGRGAIRPRATGVTSMEEASL